MYYHKKKIKMVEKLIFPDDCRQTYAIAKVESTNFYLPKNIVRHMKCESIIKNGKHSFVTQGILVDDFCKLIQYLILYGEKPVSTSDYKFLDSLSVADFVRFTYIQEKLAIHRLYSLVCDYLTSLYECGDPERTKRHSEILNKAFGKEIFKF